jgi:hypothetical protein
MDLHDGCRSNDWRLYRETRRRLDPHVAQPKAGPRNDVVSKPNENLRLGGGPCGKVELLLLTEASGTGGGCKDKQWRVRPQCICDASYVSTDRRDDDITMSSAERESCPTLPGGQPNQIANQATKPNLYHPKLYYILTQLIWKGCWS